MLRIKKLETHYQEQLKEKAIKDISVFIQSIINADVTKSKYTRFLIDAFLNDKFLEEDLVGGLESTVGQAISLFDKHKGKLSVEQRSIYALDKETGEALYQSPGDLWNVVKQYQGELLLGFFFFSSFCFWRYVLISPYLSFDTFFMFKRSSIVFIGLPF